MVRPGKPWALRRRLAAAWVGDVVLPPGAWETVSTHSSEQAAKAARRRRREPTDPATSRRWQWSVEGGPAAERRCVPRRGAVASGPC